MREEAMRGVRFLLRRQLPSGEFPTLSSNERSFINAQAQSNVFTTAVILHALRPVKEDPAVRAAARRAIEWLKAQRDSSGFWTFWGRAMRNRPPEDAVPPDVDCSACIVGVFKDWDVDFPYAACLRALAGCRNEKGLFGTWIHGTGLDWHPDVAPFIDRQDVDPVVNANAACLFQRHGRVLPEVTRYLEDQILRRRFHQPSNYYVSPAVFLYALGKLASDHPPWTEGELGKACREVLTSLLTATDPAKVTPLEKAMALSAAFKGSLPLPKGAADRALAGLRELQAADGGWEAHPFHSFYFLHYGSRELTTALAVEALALKEEHDKRHAVLEPAAASRRP
ncbi:MAG: terpene cyclase/mutase family protein [Elusimicrobia bacterium]|nr:terpene cyclase/mutase family protein [Elusimicrobiota bacterium]